MRQARPLRFACLLPVLLGTGMLLAHPACAQGIAKRFSHTLKPGGVAEECFRLPADASIGYAFEAAAPVDFNVHFHRGNDIEYPMKSPQVREAAARFVAPSAQEYCLMWTNPTATPIVVRGTLSP